jgi:hypothetical protein
MPAPQVKQRVFDGAETLAKRLIRNGLLKLASHHLCFRPIPVCRPSSTQKLTTTSGVLAKWLRTEVISFVTPTLWLAGFGKQTGLVNNLETWANLTGAEISPVC